MPAQDPSSADLFFVPAFSARQHNRPTERNAEERRAARMANPCQCTKEGATELLRQKTVLLQESQQQTREALQVAKKATAAFHMTLDGWLKGGSSLA